MDFEFNSFNSTKNENCFIFNEDINLFYNNEMDKSFSIYKDENNSTTSANNSNKIIKSNTQENSSINEIKKNDNFKELYIKKQKEKRDFLDKRIEYQSNETKKLLGRKTKESKKVGPHNKYADDNLIIKIKVTLVDLLYKCINSLLEKLYGNKKRQLKKLNKKKITNCTVDENIKFLYKTLKEIFSYNISTKFKYVELNHNEKLIQNLLNEEDEEKKKIFENLFNLNFFECLKHFRNDVNYEELKGLEKLDTNLHKFDNNDDYEDSEMYKNFFKFYVQNFEEIIQLKKGRTKRTQNE